MNLVQTNSEPDESPGRTGGLSHPSNREIAAVLSEIADLLETQGAIVFRFRAYREAAKKLLEMEQPVAEVLCREGTEGLVALPTIGHSIAKVIDQYARHQRSSLLERLRGENVSERLFTTVPDIGPKLAREIHAALGIETLPELQAAALDGRLSHVAGMGTKRIRAVRESLASRLGQRQTTSRFREATEIEKQTPVAELLDVDEEYRRLTEAGRLTKIAPRAFNPSGAAWLPILHTEREGRHYTALFSNTARAHELNTVHDWVVIYREDQHVDARWTVITSQYGPIKGQRIVRGREDECVVHYEEVSIGR